MILIGYKTIEINLLFCCCIYVRIKKDLVNFNCVKPIKVVVVVFAVVVFVKKQIKSKKSLI